MPGETWSLRVTGRAWLTRDPSLLQPVAGGTVRRLAVGVAVEQTYVHCGRAFQLGQVWDPSTWGSVAVPDVTALFRAHVALASAAPGSG